MNRRLFYAAGGIVTALILAVVLFFVLSRRGGDAPSDSQRISTFLGINLQGDAPIDIADDLQFQKWFDKDITNEHTVDLFKFLQMRFKNSNFEDHYRDVYQYLLSKFGEQKAQALLALYKKYIDYERELPQQKELWNRERPKTTEDAMALLRDIHKYREQQFGKDMADELFGEEMRLYEYQLRRNDIINGGASGRDKEAAIRGLQRELWSAEGERLSMSEFDRYELKMKLYSSELKAAGPEQQLAMKKQFREQVFTPEEAARLDELEWHEEQERRKAQGLPENHMGR